jgi:hypothetical protein
MVSDKEDNKKGKEERNEEGSEAGFTVKDKRRIGKEEEKETASSAQETTKPEDIDTSKETEKQPEAKEGGPPPDEKMTDGEQELPPIDFMSFIMSLSTSALIYLGEVPDPVDNETKKIIPMAKQMIDLISLLSEKTKGNLTADEEKYMENILFELRMLFIKASPK